MEKSVRFGYEKNWYKKTLRFGIKKIGIEKTFGFSFVLILDSVTHCPPDKYFLLNKKIWIY